MTFHKQRTMLCVDPSLSSTGWALFDGDVLVRCGSGLKAPGSINPRKQKLPGRMVTAGRFLGEIFADCLVVEVPQVYGGKGGKGDPNHLTPLWGVAGGIFALHHWSDGNQWAILPHDWKGSVDPHVMFARILKKLRPDELMVFNCGVHRQADDMTVPKKTQQAGDALDAIGIGLTVLERMGRGNPIS